MITSRRTKLKHESVETAVERPLEFDQKSDVEGMVLDNLLQIKNNVNQRKASLIQNNQSVLKVNNRKFAIKLFMQWRVNEQHLQQKLKMTSH